MESISQNINRAKVEIDKQLRLIGKVRESTKNAPDFLTDEEIKLIIDSVPPIKSADIEDAELARTHIQDKLTIMLKLPINKMIKSAIPDFIQEMVHKFERAKSESGLPVGLLAAQAIAAQLMQSTLNTFHTSGSGTNISAGIDAYRDLLQLSKDMKAPTCDIYFKNIVDFDDVVMRKRPDIVYITIDDVVKSVEVLSKKDLYEDDGQFKYAYYSLYDMMYNIGRPNPIQIVGHISDNNKSGTSFLRLHLNVDMMYKQQIMPEDICNMLSEDNEDNILCIPSPLLMLPITKQKMYYNTNTKINEYHDVTTYLPHYYIDIYTHVNEILREFNNKYNITSNILGSEDAMVFKHVWVGKIGDNPELSNELYNQVFKYYDMDILIDDNKLFINVPNVPNKEAVSLYNLSIDPSTGNYNWSPLNVIDYKQKYENKETNDLVQMMISNIHDLKISNDVWKMDYNIDIMRRRNISKSNIDKMIELNNIDILDSTLMIIRIPLINSNEFYSPIQLFKYNLQNESRDNINNVYFNTIIIPNLKNIKLKGVNGIKSLYPEKLSVWSAVSEEIKDGDSWTLRFHKTRMNQTGITPGHIQRLCEIAGMKINEFETEKDKIKYQYDYLSVKTPPIPSDARKVLNIQPDKRFDIWKPGQVINYHKLKGLDENVDYTKEAEAEKDRLILEGKFIESDKISTVKPASEFEKALEFIYAMSEGTNLNELLIGFDNIDPTRTISNNIHEILENFGIEAARAYFAERLYKIVIANKNYVNPQHTLLIADHVTRLGFLTPITLTGLKKNPAGFLTKAGHSKASETFKAVASTGATESLNPTYQSMMTGKLLNMGTGMVDVSLNKRKEKELYDNFDIGVIYGISAQSLAKEIENIDTNESNIFNDMDDFEEDIYYTMDDNNIIISTTSPMAKPTQIDPVQMSPNIIGAIPQSRYGSQISPKPIKSNVVYDVAASIPSSPVVQRDNIEDITIAKLKEMKEGDKEEEFIGVMELPNDYVENESYYVSYPVFTEGAGGLDPATLSNLISSIQ